MSIVGVASSLIDTSPRRPTDDAGLGWHALPRGAQWYVSIVLAAGALTFVAFFPVDYPRPLLFIGTLAAACLTSIWKVNLPIPLASSATLSVADAANLFAVLLLGPQHAVFIASAGVVIQCTVNASRPYPWYRTLFSASAAAMTMVATWLAYTSLREASSTTTFPPLAIAGAIAAYFVVNTGVVSAAIALSTGRGVWRVWRDDFLWSGMSFMIAGGAGVAAAVIIGTGDVWTALLVVLPVYVTYRTYRLFVERLSSERTLTSGVVAALSDRLADAQKQYRDAVEMLLETQMSERELAGDRQRLAAAVANMAHVQELHDQALAGERAARSGAERANRLKDQFLATVSHELRTPLNAILGWADMLCTGGLEDTRRERACQAIYTSAQHQAQLVNELLDVARIMSGKLQLDLLPVDVQDVVRRAIESVQPTADARHIDIAFDDDPVTGMVYGDATRLLQVVSNLLGNAVKFTNEGGAVHVRLRRAGDLAEIVVTDTGAGIPCELLGAVFEPFRQADGSTTRRHGGLGLGLSIVKQLVEAHHGTVSAASGGEGQGATFTVRLPIAAVHGAAIDTVAADSSHAEVPAPSVVSLAGIRVLVVDDHDGSRQVMAAHLDAHAASVLTAASASEALALLQQERVDVLLADVGMPDQDGYALIRQLRGMRPAKVASVPAAAVTGFARSEDRERALEAGFDEHLAKPFDSHTLIAAVAGLARTRATAT
jgi:signal transduction histidine kinase/ActR/RegA family two-component response regulator